MVGGISRDTREAFAIVVPDRSAPTLEQAIIQHVLPGTRIITDCWAAYSNLERLGYFHETVNHSRNFVNTNDPTVYTNTIERHWGLLKQIIPRQTHGDLRYSYLAEYIWKMKKGWFRLSIG